MMFVNSLDVLANLQKSPQFWNNHNIQSGKKPFVFKPWSDQGVFVLGDIFNNQGLRSFQDLKECYNLPGHSYFLYFRLRSAMCAYGVPWICNLDIHPLMDCIHFSQTHGAVSLIYNKLLNHGSVHFPSLQYGKRNRPPINLTGNAYGKVFLRCPRILPHQLIHFKLIHKAYATPYVLHRMKRLPTPLCILCNSNTVGTYMHMFFDCPLISKFWDKVFLTVSELCDRFIPKRPVFVCWMMILILIWTFTNVEYFTPHLLQPRR